MYICMVLNQISDPIMIGSVNENNYINLVVRFGTVRYGMKQFVLKNEYPKICSNYGSSLQFFSDRIRYLIKYHSNVHTDSISFQFFFKFLLIVIYYHLTESFPIRYLIKYHSNLHTDIISFQFFLIPIK